MEQQSNIIGRLVAALQALDVEDDTESTSERVGDSSSRFADFKRMLRRVGQIEGVTCYIRQVGGSFVLNGFKEGDWTLSSRLWTDLEDDAMAAPSRAEFELIQISRTDTGPEGYPETVHVIRGMDSSSQADIFFDSNYVDEWHATPLYPEIEDRKSTISAHERAIDPNPRNRE